MKFFSHSLFLGLCASTLLLGGANEYSVRAQSYGSSVAGPKIEPAAQALLDQMKAAYKAIDFYASDIEMKTEGLPDSPQLNGKIAWHKPNKLRLQGDAGAGETQIISNGTTLTLTIARAPKQYVQKKAPTSGSTLLSSALTELGGDKTTLGMLITGKDPLRQFGSSLQSIALKKVTTKTATGNQIASDRVALVLTLSRRTDTGTAILIVGTKDHLLRSVNIKKTVSGQPVTISELYNNRRLTPENESFEYSPPAGTMLVSAFENLGHNPRLAVGAPPLRIDVKDTAGQLVNLDEYKGKVVLLDFWASWCPPCRADAPEVVQLYNRNKSAGFEVVGINMDADAASLKAMADYYGMTWRQTFDGKVWENVIARRYGVPSIPFTVVIGRDGKVSAINARGSELDSEVRKALAQKAQ